MYTNLQSNCYNAHQFANKLCSYISYNHKIITQNLFGVARYIFRYNVNILRRFGAVCTQFATNKWHDYGYQKTFNMYYTYIGQCNLNW